MVDSNHKMILASGRFRGTSRTQLTAAFDAFLNSPQKNTLVIHFHGGLVSQGTAEKLAEELLDDYQTAGGYPFFVIWQTQVWETLRNNWQEIIKEDAFSILVERSVQFLLGKLDQAPGERGGEVTVPSSFKVQEEIEEKRTVGGEPFAERNTETRNLDAELSEAEQAQFESMLKDDPLLQDAAAQLSRPDGPTLNPELEAELQLARASEVSGDRGFISTTALIGAGLRIIGRALKRFSGGRDHGLYTTVMEEVFRELKGDVIGSVLWRHIKKDTVDSFKDDDVQFGGTALLKEIARTWEAAGKPRIVLIGHSAGSVYICNLLTKAAAILPPEIRFEVIFLAPACTFELLDGALEAAGDRISSFRSYGMKDAIERKDAIFPPLYLYSLLYFVSGLLEDDIDYPLVGMERFSSAALNFDQTASPEIGRVLGRLAKFQSPWVWSDIDGGAGLMSSAAKHGDFDNDGPTLTSIAHLIKNGVM